MPTRSLQVAVAAAGSWPSTRDLAGAARAVALEDLDGGRLAGAVRAEQPEDLAALDLEDEPAHGLDRPIGLVQVDHLDGRGCHPARLSSGPRNFFAGRASFRNGPRFSW